jgi:protein TonB
MGVVSHVQAAYRTTAKPDYPERARREGKEGRVLLRVLVDTDGRSEIVQVDSSSGSELLDQAARDAVRRWRFSPARDGDKAVPSWVKIPIEFRLSDVRN